MMATSVAYWRTAMRASSSRITLATFGPTSLLDVQQKRTLATESPRRRKPPQVERAIRLRESQKRRERRAAEGGRPESGTMEAVGGVQGSDRKTGSWRRDDDQRRDLQSRGRNEDGDHFRRRQQEDKDGGHFLWHRPSDRDERRPPRIRKDVKTDDDLRQFRSPEQPRREPELTLREKRWRIAEQLRQLNYNNESPQSTKAYEEAEEIFAKLPPILRRTVFIYIAMIRHAISVGRTHRALQLLQLMRKDGIAPSLEVYRIIFVGMRELKISADVNVAIVRAARALYADLETLLDEKRDLERKHTEDEVRDVIKANTRPHGYDGAVTADTAESYRISRQRTLLETIELPEKLFMTRFQYVCFLESAGLAEEAKPLHDELRASHPDYDNVTEKIRATFTRNKLVRPSGPARHKAQFLADGVYDEYRFLKRGAVGEKDDVKRQPRVKGLALTKSDMQDIMSSTAQEDDDDDATIGGPRTIDHFLLKRRIEEEANKDGKSKSSE